MYPWNLLICLHLSLKLYPSVFLPSRHFLCSLLSFLSPLCKWSALQSCHWKVLVSSQATGSAESSLTLELIQSQLQVCCPANSRRTQTLQRQQNTTFKRLSVISINSWTLRNQQSTLSSETDFERERHGEREREWAVKHTLSFIPSHYIPES